MRIVAGRFRGLKLAEFSAEGVRPTSDRVKESLFDILGAKTAGATVLDLFCGSGNLGIEAISRGAEYVCFNDNSAASIEILKKNLAKLKGAANYSVSCRDYLLRLSSAREKFDIIFLDPPYALDYGEPALKLIAELGLLKQGGVAVYERDRFYDGCQYLRLYDVRKYGRAVLSFFKVD